MQVIVHDITITSWTHTLDTHHDPANQCTACAPLSAPPPSVWSRSNSCGITFHTTHFLISTVWNFLLPQIHQFQCIHSASPIPTQLPLPFMVWDWGYLDQEMFTDKIFPSEQQKIKHELNWNIVYIAELLSDKTFLAQKFKPRIIFLYPAYYDRGLLYKGWLVVSFPVHFPCPSWYGNEALTQPTTIEDSYNGWSLVLKMKTWEWGYEAGNPEFRLKNEYELSRYNWWPSAIKWVQRYSQGWWNPEVILVMFQECVTIDDDTTHTHAEEMWQDNRCNAFQCTQKPRTAKIMTGNWVFMAMLKLPSWLRLILLFCLALNRYRKPSSRLSKLEASDTQK